MERDIAVRERFSFEAHDLSVWKALGVSWVSVCSFYLLLQWQPANTVTTIVKWWAAVVAMACGTIGSQIAVFFLMKWWRR